jgi:excisionase family DNA binding protein
VTQPATNHHHQQRRYRRADYLTIIEAAHTLRIGRTKLYDLLSTGDLRSIHIDGRRYVELASLRGFVDGLRAAA